MGGIGSGRKPDTTKRELQKYNAMGTPIGTGDSLFIPNYSGDHSAGNIQDTPVDPTDLTNKAYVDSIVTGSENYWLSGGAAIWPVSDKIISGSNAIVYDNLSVGYQETSETIGGASVGIKSYVGIEGNDSLAGTWMDRHTNIAAFGAHLLLAKSRGLTHATSAVVQDNDVLGSIYNAGYDGTDYALSSQVQFEVDEPVPAAGKMGGAIVLKTATSGSEALAERMRIDSSGKVTIAKDVEASGFLSGSFIEGDGSKLRNLPSTGDVQYWVSGSNAISSIGDLELSGATIKSLSGATIANTAYSDYLSGAILSVSGASVLNTAKVSYTDATQFQVVSGATIVNSAKTSYTDATQFQVVSGATIVNSAKTSYTDAVQYQVTSGGLALLSGAYATHAADSSDPHGTIVTQTDMALTSGAITGDRTLSGAAYVGNIIFGTNETPPTASNYTKGSIYVQYTP